MICSTATVVWSQTPTDAGGSSGADASIQHLSSEDHFKQGTAALEAGESKLAVQHLTESVRLKPGFREGWYNLALAHSKLRNTSEEVAAYQKAIKVDPNYAKAYYNLGICFEEQNKLSAAAQMYAKTAELDETALDAWMNLGVVLAQLKRLPEALKAYEAALKINSEIADVHYNQGIARQRMAGAAAKKEDQRAWHEKALRSYAETLRLKPNYYKAEYNRAIVYHKLGRQEEEIQAFKNALKIHPKYPQALYNLARILEKAERYDQALMYWRQYLNQAQNFPTEEPYIPVAQQAIQRLQGLASNGPGVDDDESP
jgi:superkiller protein 3